MVLFKVTANLKIECYTIENHKSKCDANGYS